MPEFYEVDPAQFKEYPCTSDKKPWFYQIWYYGDANGWRLRGRGIPHSISIECCPYCGVNLDELNIDQKIEYDSKYEKAWLTLKNLLDEKVSYHQKQVNSDSEMAQESGFAGFYYRKTIRDRMDAIEKELQI